ncbi:MAG: ABC transporter ATP-binding protein [Candidatus Zixiibacteriota bacterium]|nr:MAG: ABC transporter ATP-binding protein [candidate division Zixibacteria bacterium]
MWDKIKWFWKYYRNYKYVLAVLLLLTPIQTAFHVAIPRLIEFTIDYAKTGVLPSYSVFKWLDSFASSIGVSTTSLFAILIVILGLDASLIYAFVQGHRAWMNMRLEWLFRQTAFDNITCKGPDFFNRFRIGDLVTRMTDDVAEKLSWFACSGIFRFYDALIFIGFTLAMMLTIDPLLTLLTAGPLPILIFIFFKSATILDRRYDYLQTRISILYDIMEACFSGIRVVKAYIQEKAQKGKFDSAVKDRRDAEISAIKATTFIDSLYMYIWQFGIIIVLLAGGFMVIKSDLSLGKLVAFVFYVIYLIFPMFDIGRFLVKSRQSAVSINRLLELEKVPPMVIDNGRLKYNADKGGHLVFSNVSLRFSEGGRKVLDDISFEVKSGQTVALVGRVGAGKSWIAAMVPRYVDPTEGGILLDGNDIRRYKLKELRKIIGYVPQEPTLFSDTVENNILFGRSGISRYDVDWAIEVSQLKDEIETFPDGIYTRIGTRGVSISGGQKQRLALARALVEKPKILILDDCTSALDSNTENALWEKLAEVMPGMDIILITHRPDVLESAHNIIVLEGGKKIESGTHFELMGNDGHYAKLYRRYSLQRQVESVT